MSGVLIIGAGPAGLAAAIGLREAQIPVRVLDRYAAPPPKIGESLPPKVEALLRILGVERAVGEAGFPRMPGTVVDLGGFVEHHPFGDGALGYQVDRPQFEMLLRTRAEALGATLIVPASVRRPVLTDARVTGLELADGRIFSADYVLDASGPRAVLARALGLRRRGQVHTVALQGDFADVSAPAFFPASSTLFEISEDGWIWSVQHGDGRRNVTVGLDVAAARGGPAARRTTYQGRLAASRLLGPLLEGARWLGPLRSFDATVAAAERYVGPGFLCAGDASSMIDPLTSQGVFKALQSGLTAAAVVRTALETPAEADFAFAYYQAFEHELAENYAAIARAFYRESPYRNQPFWRNRLDSEDRGVAVEWIDRRNRLLAALTARGGQEIKLLRRPDVLLEPRGLVVGGRVVRRPAAVRGAVQLVQPSGIELERILALADGRSLEALLEAYREGLGLDRSYDLARRVILSVAGLVARDLLAVDGLPPDAVGA